MSKKTKDDDILRGSGDVFADLGFADAPVMRLKSRVATEIARTLDRRELSVRAAAKEAGTTAADVSRIRNADLDRFTLDRLVRIADRLGCRIAIKVSKAA
jgi:predicted XRE-type DNA-binding protein